MNFFKTTNSTNFTNHVGRANGCTVQHELHECGRQALVRFVLHLRLKSDLLPFKGRVGWVSI